MEFTIEKNVKRPTSKNRRRYPFPDMQVGDSFFAPAAEVAAETLRSAAAQWASRNGWAFSILKEESNGVNGVRCWRTK